MKRLFYWILVAGLLSCQVENTSRPGIDREAVVRRHNIEVEGFDPLASLSVGNGNFVFTTDLTGLQTFPSDYEEGVPLGTQSNWGWHSNPNSEKFERSETFKHLEVNGRSVPYRHQPNTTPRARAAANYFRENPHRLHLGMIGLVLSHADGTRAALTDIIKAVHQLDLWTGTVRSSFTFDGKPVSVEVVCHPVLDMVSVKVESGLIASGQLQVEWTFPFAVPENTHAGYDFHSPEKHRSNLVQQSLNSASIERSLDDDAYHVGISWEGQATLRQGGAHEFTLTPSTGAAAIAFSCHFSPNPPQLPVPAFQETAEESTKNWMHYWMKGGFVDFSECTDPRAAELERRTILSQYLTKIHSSGFLPPAETGLTYNSWYGKFHLEMHWWHVAHFPQWQRPRLIEQQLEYYRTIYDKARATAEEQGYKGVRWPKMVGPEGQNSPSSIGSYLIWQQPHYIYFAEQMYQQDPSPMTLEKYADLVFATADFMADFPVRDPTTGIFHLGPPLIPAQEHWPLEETYDPPFELAYWHWGLTVAQEWKTRLGLPPDAKWEKVRLNLPAPDQSEGTYLGVKGAVDSYTNPEKMRDHPSVLGAYGILPEWEKLDTKVMRRTMRVIAERWDWPSTWGWDYPMAAMSAARLGDPQQALEFLLMDVQKNTYLKNGHNYQSERLRIYLPGNGGLLKAVGMMCAGWEGSRGVNPGFPNDGTWNVRWEDISPAF